MKRRLDVSDNRKGLLDVVREAIVTPVTPEPKPPSSTQRTERRLRRAPLPVLERTKRLYDWVGTVGWLATPTCLLLGVWVDWRWLPTALLPVCSWVLAHQVTGLIDAELDRRREEADGCPDQLG